MKVAFRGFEAGIPRSTDKDDPEVPACEKGDLVFGNNSGKNGGGGEPDDANGKSDGPEEEAWTKSVGSCSDVTECSEIYGQVKALTPSSASADRLTSGYPIHMLGHTECQDW